jgi:superfamily I DNA and/or RNA helicase
MYNKLDNHIIRSDKFTDELGEAKAQLDDCRVILCTLSMLPNNEIGAYTSLVPITTVIVDEASQIEVGDYFPLLHLYNSTLSKIVFVGDNKQREPTVQ